MTRLILGLVLLVVCAEPVQAAVTAAQAATSSTKSSTQNKALAYGSNVVAGNLLVATVGWNGFVTDDASATDTQGNTWVIAGSKQTDSGEGNAVVVFWTTAGSSAANTVSVTFTNHAQTEVTLTLYEYHDSGGGIWSLDGTPTGVNDGASTTTPSAGSVTTTASASAAVAVLVSHFGTTSAGSGWTQDHTEDLSGTNISTYSSESRITSGAGSITGNWTSGGGAFAAAIAAFKPSAGGGAPDMEFIYRRRAS